MHQIDGEPHALRIAADDTRIAVDYKYGLIKLKGTHGFTVLSTGDGTPFLGLSETAFGSDGAL